MLRVRILSDLHREFGPTAIPTLDSDLIVLAGDIDKGTKALPWLRVLCGDTPTVYICGNHEFYGGKLPRVTENLMEETRGTNIQVLEDSAFQLGDWHIYGCTLWADMKLHGDADEGSLAAGVMMNDYKKIRHSLLGYRALRPADTRLLHTRSLLRLEAFLKTHDPRRTIVVTHHAPSARSLPEHRQAELISCAYASHLDDFILQHQPRLWVHGHIHHCSDYQIGETRIVANPQGYPMMEKDQGFNPELILELD